MTIKWFGHACFMFQSESGTTIIIDPFDSQVGYAVPDLQADIVLKTHDHYDHNNISAVKGSYALIDAPGLQKIKGVRIEGFAARHDEQDGALRGNIVMFKMVIDGVSILHVGDLGHMLSARDVMDIGKVDVLCVPVGGTYTIDADGAKTVVETLKPKLVIPMHYKTEATGMNIAGVAPFLKVLGWEVEYPSQQIEVQNEPLSRKVLVMDYK